MRNQEMNEWVQEAFKTGFVIHDREGLPTARRIADMPGSKDIWYTAMVADIHASMPSYMRGDRPVWPSSTIIGGTNPFRELHALFYSKRDGMDESEIKRHIVAVRKGAEWTSTLQLCVFGEPIVARFRNHRDVTQFSVPFRLGKKGVEYHRPKQALALASVRDEKGQKWVQASTLFRFYRYALPQGQVHDIGRFYHICRHTEGNYVVELKVGEGPKNWSDAETDPKVPLSFKGPEMVWFRKEDAEILLTAQEFSVDKK